MSVARRGALPAAAPGAGLKPLRDRCVKALRRWPRESPALPSARYRGVTGTSLALIRGPDVHPRSPAKTPAACPPLAVLRIRVRLARARVRGHCLGSARHRRLLLSRADR